MRLITQSEAADLAGVSKVTIHGLSRRRWQFFYSSPGAPDQIDVDHPHWKMYMKGEKPLLPGQKRGAREDNGQKKKQQKQGAGGSARKSVVKKKAKKADTRVMGGEAKKPVPPPLGDDDDNDESGVIDIERELKRLPPLSLKELKTQAEIQKLNIEMHARLGELIDRRIVDERLGELSRQVQMFVDLDRRLAARICQKLDRVGMEREVEKIIAPEVKKIIEDFKNACQRGVKR